MRGFAKSSFWKKVAYPQNQDCNFLNFLVLQLESFNLQYNDWQTDNIEEKNENCARQIFIEQN
jgi:hypothetical protein